MEIIAAYYENRTERKMQNAEFVCVKECGKCGDYWALKE
jgi:hypothetical protein